MKNTSFQNLYTYGKWLLNCDNTVLHSVILTNIGKTDFLKNEAIKTFWL